MKWTYRFLKENLQKHRQQCCEDTSDIKTAPELCVRSERDDLFRKWVRLQKRIKYFYMANLEVVIIKQIVGKP